MAEKNAAADTAETTSDKSVELESGGSLSLKLTANLMELSKEDRAFVFELIDKLNDYEKAQAAKAEAKAKAKADAEAKAKVENKAGAAAAK